MTSRINSESLNENKERVDEESFKKKEYLGNIDSEDLAHGTDSGFLSGPQNSFYEEQEEQKYNDPKSLDNSCNDLKPDNGKPTLGSKNSGEKTAEDACVVDSGCIDEEECNEVEQRSVVQDTNTLPSEQLNSENASTTKDKSTHDNNMRLEHDVDSHIAERFCNLSLQHGPINDLNGSDNRANVEPTPAATAPKHSAEPSNQLPAWEQCYQQNDDGDTYLHLACISGYDNVVAALIRLAIHPCLLNIKNDYGQTPLHLAALTKQRKILRMLLLAGAEPTLRDRHGNTSLHLACMSGDEQCVNALTMPFSGSEINEAHRQYGYRSNDKLFSSLSYACLPSGLEIRNYNGEYCVHLAAEAGNLQILRTLVQSGADINAKEGKGGYTPLHIAIEKNNEELFNFLLDDCKPTLNVETTTFGRLTPYQLACILNRTQMQSILEKHGAEPLTPPDSEYESDDDDSDLEESKNYDRIVETGIFGNFKGGNAMAVM
uniref:NF-kappa-B inhibitor cactus n=2 Tax=Ceratitis capitata TaxID=7213 RepID=W8BRG3_CERCA